VSFNQKRKAPLLSTLAREAGKIYRTMAKKGKKRCARNTSGQFLYEALSVNRPNRDTCRCAAASGAACGANVSTRRSTSRKGWGYGNFF